MMSLRKREPGLRAWSEVSSARAITCISKYFLEHMSVCLGPFGSSTGEGSDLPWSN